MKLSRSHPRYCDEEDSQRRHGDSDHGRDKGRKGAVIEVLADDRLRVEGLNMSKKHQKPNPQMGVQGGIIEREAPCMCRTY